MTHDKVPFMADLLTDLETLEVMGGDTPPVYKDCNVYCYGAVCH